MNYVLRAIARLALAVALLIAFAFAAYAADVTNTDVSIPFGNWIVAALPLVVFIVLVLVGVLVAFAVKLLPPWAQAIATPALQAEAISLAATALNWGVQATTNAVKDKELDINVGNAVIASAAQDAINTWPQAVIARLGGLDGIKKWLLTQAEDHGIVLPADSNAQQVLASPQVKAVTGPTVAK